MSSKNIFRFYLFVTLLLFLNKTVASHCSLNDENNPLHMKSLLPKNYITISPPVKYHPVFIGLEIKDVDSINDAQNYFSLQLYLFEVWKDSRLNTTQLTSDEYITITDEYSSCLWTPTLLFEASTHEEQMLDPKSVIHINKANIVARKSRYSFRVRCHMNLKSYPMDRHHCHFKIRPFSDTVDKLDLHLFSHKSNPSTFLLETRENPEASNETLSAIRSAAFTPSLFEISMGSMIKYNTSWLNQNYSTLDIVFLFERTITASVLTVYIPSSLIVTLSWLQFWFDVEAVPGRMSLGIMSTLTIMTQILTNYEKAANHVTAVDIWLFVCLIMVFLALMEYSMAYTISHYYDMDGNLRANNSMKQNLSILFRKSVNCQTAEKINQNNCSQQACCDEFTKVKANQDVPIKSLADLCLLLQNQIKSLNDLQNKLDDKCKCNRHLNQVDYVSRYVFPISFVLFVILYWVGLIWYTSA